MRRRRRIRFLNKSEKFGSTVVEIEKIGVKIGTEKIWSVFDIEKIGSVLSTEDLGPPCFRQKGFVPPYMRLRVFTIQIKLFNCYANKSIF